MGPAGRERPESHEYGIYLLGRYDTRVVRLATRFQRFVLTHCFRGMIAVGEGEAVVETDSERCEYVEYLVHDGFGNRGG